LEQVRDATGLLLCLTAAGECRRRFHNNEKRSGRW
jgi:hypothetical protein